MGHKCCMCSKECVGVTIQLTDEEKAAVQAMGQKPTDSYTYCRPCFRVLSDPEQGARLIQGVFHLNAKLVGLPNAEALAQKYHDLLISKARVSK